MHAAPATDNLIKHSSNSRKLCRTLATHYISIQTLNIIISTNYRKILYLYQNVTVVKSSLQ